MWTISALALLVAALSFAGLDVQRALISCALGWTMLAIAVSDMRRFIVPDILSLPAIPLGLIASGYLARAPSDHPIVLWHTGAAVLGALGLYAVGAAYRLVRKRQGLGLGDVKLAAVAGAWTGPEGLVRVILVTCVGALTFVLYLGVRGGQKPSAATPIPLGAFLAPSIWIMWFAGQVLAP